MIRVKKNVEVYETIENFKRELSSKVSPNVKLDNVKNLFLYFGSFLVLVSFTFVVDNLVKQLKKLKKNCRRIVRHFK